MKNLQNGNFLVSVIIPAHNEEKTIGKVLDSLINQTYSNKEIIVVDDCSTDNTKPIVQVYKDIMLIMNDKNLGLAKSINAGLKKSSGDIAIVLHSDCIPAGNEWINQMIEPLQIQNVGAVVSQRMIPENNLMSLSEKLFNSVVPQELLNTTGKPVEIDFFRDKADAYKLNIIRDLGYFDETISFAAGEDTDLSFKMRNKGFKILLSEKAKIEYVFSSHQRSIKSIYKKALQYGQAAAVLYRRYDYDGLKSRLYLLCIWSFLNMALNLINIYLSLFISLILLVYSFTFKIYVPIYNKKILFGSFLVILVFMLAGVDFLMKSKIELQIIALSNSIGCMLFYFYKSLKSSLKGIKSREDILLIPLFFLSSLIWNTLLAVGYLNGYLFLILKKPKWKF